MENSPTPEAIAAFKTRATTVIDNLAAAMKAQVGRIEHDRMLMPCLDFSDSFAGPMDLVAAMLLEEFRQVSPFPLRAEIRTTANHVGAAKRVRKIYNRLPVCPQET